MSGKLRSRARWPLFAMVLCLMVVVTACGSASSPAAKPADTKAAPAPAAPAPAPAAAKPAAPAPAPAAKVQPMDLVFGASTQGGSWYPIGAGIGKAIEKQVPGSRVSIREGGGEVNPTMTDEKKFDIAIASAYAIADAIKGHGDYKRPHPNISYLATLFPGYFQIGVLPNSPIKSIADLKGKRISGGPAGGSSLLQLDLVLSAYGMSLKDMAKIEYVSFNEGAVMLKDGVVDALTTGSSGAPIAAMQDVAAARGLRLLPIEPDKLKFIESKVPSFIPSELAAGVYKGQDKISTYKSNAALLARKDLSEDAVYQIMNSIFTNLDSVRAIHVLLKEWSLDKAASEVTSPLHPGAERFFKEKGVLKK